MRLLISASGAISGRHASSGRIVWSEGVGSACRGVRSAGKSLGHEEVANVSGTLPKLPILTIV